MSGPVRAFHTLISHTRTSRGRAQPGGKRRERWLRRRCKGLTKYFWEGELPTIDAENYKTLCKEIYESLLPLPVDVMIDGVIDWENASQLEEVYVVEPGETVTINKTENKIWTLVIMHNTASQDSDVMEVKVINYYGEDVMWKAVALSLPSLWMTGFVIHRLKRLKGAGLSMIDSTPSHLWIDEEE